MNNNIKPLVARMTFASCMAMMAATINADVLLDDGFNAYSESGRTSLNSSQATLRGGSSDAVITSPIINTAGFDDLSLAFSRQTSGLDSGESFTLAVSLNGGAFTALESAQSASSSVSFDLSNAEYVSFRVTLNASSYYEKLNVDQLTLTGSSSGETPPSGIASCDNLMPGTFDCELGDRDYTVHVPPSYTGSGTVPLVIDMHGYTSNKEEQQEMSGWEQLANQEGFIVAWPQGVDDSWNAQGQCCGASTEDDPQFIRDLVGQIQADANIDASKIYATGLSNGGSMSHTLACEAADIFAATAPVAFTISGGYSQYSVERNCNPSEPISIIHFHGSDDELVDFDNGVLDALGVEESLESWVDIQNCSNQSATATLLPGIECKTHACPGEIELTQCVVEGGPHVLYPDVSGKGIAGYAWDLFKKF